jgi:aminomethyltransferase
MKMTPLNNAHRKLGARMIDFSGWDMPVSYTSLLEEHRAVRERAGLFDVSHMGECRITGPDSIQMVNWLISNNSLNMRDGQILYSPMCNERGGCVDDLIVYRFGPEDFLLIINASNTEKDFLWIKEHTGEFRVTLTDESAQWGQLALQGPLAQEILAGLVDLNLENMGFFTFLTGRLGETEVILSRSGYTGEDGFEIYCPAQETPALWNIILDTGKKRGVLPCGLGARDTLRFEAALPLYGNELSDGISPLEAGLGRFVKFEGEDFIGREALRNQKEKGLPRCLVGFELIGKGIPRHGYSIYDRNENEIGVVTTGYAAPTVGKTVGMALIETDSAVLERKILIGIRNKMVEAVICDKRFYTRKYRK